MNISGSRPVMPLSVHADLRRDTADGPWEHGAGADWEQLHVLNMPEQSSMDLNGPRRPARVMFSQVSTVS